MLRIESDLPSESKRRPMLRLDVDRHNNLFEGPTRIPTNGIYRLNGIYLPFIIVGESRINGAC